jgi:hypothetical protein
MPLPTGEEVMEVVQSYGAYMGTPVSDNTSANRAFSSLTEMRYDPSHPMGWIEDDDLYALKKIDGGYSRSGEVLLSGALFVMSLFNGCPKFWSYRTLALLGGSFVVFAGYLRYWEWSAASQLRGKVAKQISDHADLMLNLVENKAFGIDYKNTLEFVKYVDKGTGNATERFAKLSQILVDFVRRCAPEDGALLDKVTNIHTNVVAKLWSVADVELC